MNPCPCGFYPDRTRCRCSQQQVAKYLSKISKPLLDRIDICAESSSISYEDIQSNAEGEDSKTIRKRVECARQIQEERFKNSEIKFNSSMKKNDLMCFCKLGEQEREFLGKVFKNQGLSVRGYEKILKVSRTIADLEGKETIRKKHLAEAVGLRNLEGKYWGEIYGQS
ncbi:ATP-binding protein [Clostridium sp. E02]|uniref:magnesium chelatase subunit ChlI family protein n=1 Tax=Clostridium sp. E02 TaxID=2487134 RepID=UPI000F547CEE|nr:ATP-binding protein [Clostridium sp. E02]